MWSLGQNKKIKFREIIMDIILLQDIESVGKAGDVVNVKHGFARNKLIPDGLALRASKRCVRLTHISNNERRPHFLRHCHL